MQDLTISLMQTSLEWESPKANLSRLAKLVRSLPVTDLVILPEMFTTGFTMKPQGLAETPDGTALKWMKSLAAEKQAVITGSFIVEEDGNYFNRLFWVTPYGTTETYDKRHLFTLAGEEKVYQPGKQRLVTSWKGWRIMPLVCYDLRFPVWSRNRDEYDLLLYVANWPERRVSAWSRLLVARAIENQAYVAGVNRIGEDGNGIYHSGHSALIDPMGEVLWEVSHSEACYTITLKADSLLQVREKLPFLNDRDSFTIHE